MKVNFMGLTGPEGVLPLVYTVFLAERARSGDSTAVDFFDTFQPSDYLPFLSGLGKIPLLDRL